MRELVKIRRLLEDEELDPDTTYVDPDDIVQIENDEADEEQEEE